MEYKVFGCKVNKYYTDKWLNSDYLRDKSGVFVASCVVTDKAKKKWIKFVKDVLSYLEKDEKVYISGCGALDKGKKDEKFFDIYPELSKFKDKIEVLGEDPDGYRPQTKINLEKLEPLKSIYTKKFIVIQGGCDSHCSFCLTVLKRGKHYYRSKEEILDEIIEFENAGGKEIVLTGVNLGAWGQENTNIFTKPKLSELLEYILENSKIQRIKISSLGPEFIDDKLISLFSNSRILPFFHLSIQSGSTKILKEMRRHYSGEYLKDILSKLNSIKRDDDVSVSIGADIIVGFPGETEDDFQDTYNLIANYKITKIHGFPFSNHTVGEHVPASFFENQIDVSTKNQRLDKILKLADEIRSNFITQEKAKTHEILIETSRNNKFTGWTKNYIDVDETNCEIISGINKKNEIVIGKLK